MPTKTSGKKSGAKKSAKKSLKVESGTVPPYGDPIRKAIARGDAQEMKNVAASARKWMSDVQSALDQLDSAMKKSSKKK
ncbi:MAG TPA: DUF1843 domain-containing protein [Pyrinomonadaceae bacterium]|jgi:uncharacterized protein DUF1843|nr:DUF1843 domain-containing protein [Pyrinomonadaceae bacterium]